MSGSNKLFGGEDERYAAEMEKRTFIVAEDAFQDKVGESIVLKLIPPATNPLFRPILQVFISKDGILGYIDNSTSKEVPFIVTASPLTDKYAMGEFKKGDTLNIII